MFNWLGQMLGINELKERIAVLESKVDGLEDSVNGVLKYVGNFKNRSEGELRLMKVQLSDQAEQIELVLQNLEEQETREKLLKLRKRLRYNLTLCTKALDTIVAES